jgi:hypothetical protein
MGKARFFDPINDSGQSEAFDPPVSDSPQLLRKYELT